jgi:hypothetical protein
MLSDFEKPTTPQHYLDKEIHCHKECFFKILVNLACSAIELLFKSLK